ncbi:glucose-6-phosphate isomerase [Tepidimonas ignava]|uniref:glucose-6-phosphate isomerase n=1 Tax=Tepidimonas ignava TaxID=114249 RepID=UPI002FDA5659
MTTTGSLTITPAAPPTAAATAPFTPPPQRLAWRRLAALARQPQPHLRTLLDAHDPTRAQALRFEAAGVTLDATRQALTLPVWRALLDMATEVGLRDHAHAMWRGAPINATEGRAVLHVALRGSQIDAPPWGTAIRDAVRHELQRFLGIAERVRTGAWQGHDGQPITDVVNLGIGGSDLGPRMAVHALGPTSAGPVRVHFFSNPDAWALWEVLRPLQPRRTLFIIQSKTFTTHETLLLAASARRWLADGGVGERDQGPHWVAVTAHPQRAQAWGVAARQVLRIWDWVGGRYSLWSAIGLPLAISIGRAAFEQLLAGAHAMDDHFLHAPLEHNLPLALALLGVWNRNFLGCPTHLLALYDARLAEFARFIQQMDMESNGKSVHVDGQPVTVETGPIVWGGLGNDAQHAYFQLLHQGTHRVPVDFIGVRETDAPLPTAPVHQQLLHTNLLAQAEALARGRDAEATAAALRAEGLSDDEVQRLVPHRTFRGNVPSNILWLPRLDPFHLGALVAAYEHKVFCQAVLWGINAYDQWGVELGKTMARTLASSTP